MFTSFKSFKILLSVFMLTFVFQQNIHAQNKIKNAKVTDAIDKVFQEWDQENTPGCALGIIKDGELIYAKGYGLANMEYNIPNDANSVFRIGSTSKQFTAACIVLLAEQGELSLDNTLYQYFPEFPDYAKTITIRHLLNHTSGIRDYLTLTYLKGLGDDDYYTDEDLMRWLVRQTDVNFTPGDEFTYSNSGYWLLAQIVKEVTGMTMAKYAEKEIFKPLGMNDTHFHDDHNRIVKNRASGYSPVDETSYELNMTTLNMIGDGGIFTTIGDIKKWDDAYYNSKVLNKNFWKMMTTKGVLNSGKEIDYASGLFLTPYKGLPTINHGGAFVGFRAEYLKFPEQKVSIAIFANRGDANPTKKAFQVADILLKDELVEETVVEEEKVQVKAITSGAELSLEQLTGDYEIQAGVVMKVSIENDVLNIVQSWNNASYDVERMEGNTFQIPGEAGISFTFSNEKDGASQQLTILQGGSETTCERVDPVDTSDVKLEDFVGEFYSQELDVSYYFLVAENELKIKLGHYDPVAISVIGADEFFYQGMSLRFLRDGDELTGFLLDAGRVSNLKFEKVK